MKIDFTQIKYTFSAKPLIIGGKAMEYYGIRPAGADIDLVITKNDHSPLSKNYPDNTVDIFGDHGVVVAEFEIWDSICTFDYEYLKVGAIEEDNYLMVSIEKLLFLKVLAMEKDEKNRRDVDLIAKHVLNTAYGTRQ